MEKNILVADDAKFMRDMIKRLLKQEGYNVVAEAENGKDAVEKFRVHEADIDLIIMDTKMPEMDGIQAIKAIREMNREVPIIVIGPADMGDLISVDIDGKGEVEVKYNVDAPITKGELTVMEAIRAGANDFCLKPFKPERLLNRVKDVIGEP